ALAAALSAHGASSGVRAPLVISTVKVATLVAAGHAAAGIIPANVAALTEGGLKAMFLTKLKIATVLLLAAGLLATAAGLLTGPALADKPAADAVKPAGAAREGAARESEVRGTLKAVDALQNTITLHAGKLSPAERTFGLTRDAKVLLDDG